MTNIFILPTIIQYFLTAENVATVLNSIFLESLVVLIQLFKSNWKDINLNKNGCSTLLTSLLVEVSGVLSEV